MCGRYLFYDGVREDIREIMELARTAFTEEDFSSLSLGEVFPGTKALSFLYDPRYQKQRAIGSKWGYAAKRLVINARSETCFESSFFRDSHACILPASGYFEWSKQPRQKYLFTRGEEMILLGGLCRREADGLHFVIMTKDAEELQAGIHNRQPVLLREKDAWLWCRTKDPRLIYERAVSPLTMTAV